MNVADTEIDGRRPGRARGSDPGGTGEPLTVGSLFSGIGGFDLGFERAGMRTVWFCEQDEFCRSVLAKHWPGVPCYPDVRALVADAADSVRRPDAGGVAGLQAAGEGTPPGGRVREGDGGAGAGRPAEGVAAGRTGGAMPVPVPYVDVLCGGFPCQDLSVAGKGAGIDGERSGLWAEYARLIRELRPRYVVVENVSALLGRGLGRVLGDLAACGYDAEWDCVPASAVGAPHRRDRLWIVAYPNGDGVRVESERDQREGRSERASVGGDPVAGDDGPQGAMADTDGAGRGERRRSVSVRAEQSSVEHGGEDVEDAADGGGQRRRPGRGDEGDTGPLGVSARPDEDGRGQWAVEPDVGRVANGIPHRVDRLSALGNALVPQIAEWLGRRIVQYETEETG